MGNFIMAVEHFAMVIGEYGYKLDMCCLEKDNFIYSWKR